MRLTEFFPIFQNFLGRFLHDLVMSISKQIGSELRFRMAREACAYSVIHVDLNP